MPQSRPARICITMSDKWAQKVPDPPLRRWPQGIDSSSPSSTTPTTKTSLARAHQRPHSAGPTFGRSRRRIIESQAREFWAQQIPSSKPLKTPETNPKEKLNVDLQLTTQGIEKRIRAASARAGKVKQMQETFRDMDAESIREMKRRSVVQDLTIKDYQNKVAEMEMQTLQKDKASKLQIRQLEHEKADALAKYLGAEKLYKLERQTNQNLRQELDAAHGRRGGGGQGSGSGSANPNDPAATAARNQEENQELLMYVRDQLGAKTLDELRSKMHTFDELLAHLTNENNDLQSQNTELKNNVRALLQKVASRVQSDDPESSAGESPQQSGFDRLASSHGGGAELGRLRSLHSKSLRVQNVVVDLWGLVKSISTNSSSTSEDISDALVRPLADEHNSNKGNDGSFWKTEAMLDDVKQYIMFSNPELAGPIVREIQAFSNKIWREHLFASDDLRGKPIEIFRALATRLKKLAASVEKFEKEEKTQKQKRREADERSKKLQMKVRRQEQEIQKLERILSHKFSQTRRGSQPAEG